jgi:glucose-6-phosphate 1-dehydrogenase
MLFTIFGATGDLTTKKLIPALYQLYEIGTLPHEFILLCIGRKPYLTDHFIKDIEMKLSGTYPKWDAFKKFIYYYALDFSDASTFPLFKVFVETLNLRSTTHKIFYLATAPRYFPIIATALIECSLLRRHNVFEKIVFEKPFGEDLSSAISYNQMILAKIEESQVYRIDHYLGKEMLQNILTVRFANKIFESIWNRDNIEKVVIYALESESVKQRGSYYNASGAMKDMVQNHLFQTLALVAMDAPKELDDHFIKNEKVKVFEGIQLTEDVIFGQYNGYLKEIDIPANSVTETFVGLKVFVNSERFKETPFYLITGKKLNEKKAGIEITFKESSFAFKKGSPKKNKLTIEIFPREGIILQFNGKAPGLQPLTMPMKLDYCHTCNVIGNSPEAYEKLILDIMDGDASLFTRWDEIENTWKIIEELALIKQNSPLIHYDDLEILKTEMQHIWREVPIE